MIIFLHIPFAVETIFWTRLRPRPLDRANSASPTLSGQVGLRQCAFALRDATLGQDGCPKISQVHSRDVRSLIRDSRKQSHAKI